MSNYLINKAACKHPLVQVKSPKIENHSWWTNHRKINTLEGKKKVKLTHLLYNPL